MLIEKNIWDLIDKSQHQPSIELWKKDKKIKENQITIGTVFWIIKEGVSNDIFNNIINHTDSKKIWEKLHIAYFQFG